MQALILWRTSSFDGSTKERTSINLQTRKEREEKNIIGKEKGGARRKSYEKITFFQQIR